MSPVKKKSSFFYLKLAADNLKKNAGTYAPYLLTCIFSVAMFYIMSSLADNSGVGTGTLQFTLELGVRVIGFFSVIFLFYTNSFLIKRRKKEFGLFNILGMEKRHLARVLFFETFFTAGLSLLAGLAAGLLLARLMFLILMRILKFDLFISFALSAGAMGNTILLFALIFLLTLANSLRMIHLSKPIELLKGGRVGEREPKTRRVLTAVGVATLGIGYYLAIVTTEPMQVILVFFAAVILVIIGTWCLFTAGSIALLKMLRKNKNYYYQTDHFISVSGMLYRMKQNASGLASICILSTMLLVTVSSTVALYIGMEDLLHTRYPSEISVSGADRGNGKQLAERVMEEILQEHDLTAENVASWRSLTFAGQLNRNRVTAVGDTDDDSDFYHICLIPLNDFEALTGKTYALKDNQVLVISHRTTYPEPLISLGSRIFDVLQKDVRLRDMNLVGAFNSDIADSFFVIVSDMDSLEQIGREIDLNEEKKPQFTLAFDLDAPDEISIAVTDELMQTLHAELNGEQVSATSRAAGRQDFYLLYGSLFFVGLFLGTLFLMATVLIIYYKQISEGYDDRERFAIMQKMGLSRAEVRRTIRTQILTMFFLPLGAAVIHIAFAFLLITRLLALLNLTNIGLFAACTLGAILLFGLLYAAVYKLTAGVYYRIVGNGSRT